MGGLSVFAPLVPRRPEQLAPFARLAQEMGSRLWQGQATVLEPSQTFAALAGAGIRVPVGIGVTLTPLRHPYYAAIEARSLAAITGHDVAFGLGPGGKSFQRSVMQKPFASPLQAMRDYVTVMRALLNGDYVDLDSETFSVHGAFGGGPETSVRIGLGVLRERMAELAGEVADDVITWLTPARYLREVVVPAVDRGAALAGKPRPRIVSIVPIALRNPRHEPYQLALASNYAHSRAPHYIQMLGRAGIRIDGVDPAAAARAIVDGRAFLSGDPEELVEMIDEYLEAGVDEIALNVTGVCNVAGPEYAEQELRSLVEALASVRVAAPALAPAGANTPPDRPVEGI